MNQKFDQMVGLSDPMLPYFSQLKPLGITIFTVLFNYDDGLQINLSSHKNWIEDYYTLGLFHSSVYDNNPQDYQSHYSIWPEYSNLPVFKHGISHYNSHYGMTLCIREVECTKFYFFSGKEPALIHLFINHKEFFQQFITYFNNTTTELIEDAKKINFINPQKREHSIGNQQRIELAKIQQLFESNLYSLQNTLLTQHDINPSVINTLTRRQIEVLYWSAKGKTAQETSEILHISPRTVERHFEKIRLRTQSSNKQEAISKILLQSIDSLLGPWLKE